MLCNEVIRGLNFPQQCRFVRETGYDGLEIAPFTLADDPARLSSETIGNLRAAADGEGVEIAGLHWLLAAPEGLSITSGDAATAARTLDVGRRLVDMCRQLGGRYLVHGSPAQRQLEPGREDEGRKHALQYFRAIASAASAADVTYIIEPLSRLDTGLITTVDEAVDIIGEIGEAALATMIDCYAAASNGETIADVLQRWMPTSHLRHIHFNDSNKRGPGEGATDFSTVIDMLTRLGYSGTAAVEPFVYLPDGPACAARSIGYLRGLMEGRGRP
jgi:D-psicose/D-tagatose/L-ribulose 3-epimerase